jgi:hypothetical protein
VTLEVPSGTRVLIVLKGTIVAASARQSEVAHAPGAPTGDSPSLAPRGPQLWLRYPGWECDDLGWRRLEPE